MDERLTELDLKLVEALMEAPLKTNKQLAADLGASQANIANRIQRLSDLDVLKVTVQRDFEAVGANFPAHIDLYVLPGWVERVAKAVIRLDEVTSCLELAGRPQLVIRVAAQSQAHFIEFLTSKIASIKGIEHITTLTVLKVRKYNLQYGRIDT